MQVIFVADRTTKNTVRFIEPGEDTKIGMLYVPKATLKELGWSEGRKLMIEVKAEEG